MSDKSFLRRDTSRRGGFTLLEVAIALAIFVFGALAIIRIFPPALGVIQNSGDQLTAVGFNRSTLARFARQPGLVPDATHDYSDLDNDPSTPLAPNPNWRDGLVGSVAGTPRHNNSLPTGNIQNVDTDYKESALGHFKNIVGERHIVRTNSATATQAVVLTQFPMEASATLDVYAEDSLSDVTVSDTGVINMTDAKFSDGTRYEARAGVTDKFYVSYRWVEGGRVWGVEDEPHTALPITVSNDDRGPIVAGEVKVRLQRPLPTSNRDNDRGSFRVPVGTPTYFGQSVVAGQKISVDYRVKDWRWMVHDGALPAVPEEIQGQPIQGNLPRSTNLTVRPLDDAITPYAYLLFSSPGLALPLTPAATQDERPGTPAAVTTTNANVNRKTGQVTFETQNPATSQPYPSPQVRVVYRTLDNWAQQLSVAANSYLLTYGTDSTEPWRDCILNATGTTLYFKPSEAGKSVLVTYSYREAGAPEDTQIDGRILTINDDLLALSNVFTGYNRVARLELTAMNGDRLTTPTPVTSIQKIQGVSIEARTAWLDGNRFSQASTIGYRGVPNQ